MDWPGLKTMIVALDFRQMGKYGTESYLQGEAVSAYPDVLDQAGISNQILNLSIRSYEAQPLPTWAEPHGCPCK